MKINISDIAALFSQQAQYPCIIEELLIDSRLLSTPEKTLFVALRTANNDGHAYVKGLIDKGVRNFIVDRIAPEWSADGINFITVGNTCEALQRIGSLCRTKLKGTVVAITGSIGKTTVKELFNSCAESAGSTVTRSPRSYNSQVGVPLSLWQLDPEAGGKVSLSMIVDSTTAEKYPDELRHIIERYGIKKCHTTRLCSPDNIVKNDFHDEIIVVNTGAECGVDKVVAILEDKQHETLMEVNLDAMVHNFNFFRSKVKPETGVICMLKAHGYGAGSVELARTLQEQGAAYIAVAVVDEGIELRRCGITMPVIVLNPRVYDFHTLFLYDLEPEVYSFDILEKLIAHFEAYDTDVRFPIHLKVDTGMRRLGFLEEDMPRVAKMLSEARHIYAKTIFSHLACADDPSEDDYTLNQFAVFGRCYDALSAALPYHIKRHILNSTGIVRFPEYQYDFVRLGIGLYGVPTMYDGSMAELRNVSRLTSTVISIKHWKKGDTVGYNRRGLLTRDSVIATVPVGYADGIDRHLGYGNASFIVNGHRCPTVGSICMDICMIDVTDAPCAVGDRVEIFGDTVTPQMLADTLTTIPYEILTSISPRVKRIYYRE